MNYRINPKNGDKLSILGFGCMRFPKDKNETEKQLLHAIHNGVNYFDTAYMYPNSEETLGSILARNKLREKVKIATKLPPYMVKKYEDLDKIFNKELARLQTNYIDYYFIHMLADVTTWNRIVDLGILKWIDEKKKSKQIRNIGFSYHGGREEFVKLVDIYDWEFTMIQYNYLDENNQAGKSGLQYASSKGLPVMVMEPLRGGNLVTKLPKEVYDVLKKSYVKRSPAEWAFRWIWNHPEVTVVLSGMNSMEMLDENIRVASDSEANAFTEKDFTLFESIRKILMEKIKVPCTACNYCMPCPAGVDIPTCFSSYNDIPIEGKIGAQIKYIMSVGIKKQSTHASLCTKCGKCELICPQKIAIRTELAKVSKEMDGFVFKSARLAMKLFSK